MSTINCAALPGRFHNLFVPGETGHGYYTLIGDGTRDDCNTEGKLDNARKGFAHEPVTVELWDLHLAGKQGLGIVPIRKNGTVMWGATDIDVYAGLDHVEIARTLLKLNLPLIVCKSKSGGAHIYLFCSEPVSATAMQNKLREIAAMLGHGKAEIFPKQTKLVDMGSWINMPYFNAAETTRYAVTPDGDHLTPEEFLDCARQGAVSPEFFVGDDQKQRNGSGKDPFIILNTPDDGPLSDAPPCLQHLALTGIASLRNETLTEFRTYLRKKNPAGWEKDLEEINRKYCPDPVDAKEMLSLQRGGRNDKDYNYRCSSEHLKPHCNWALCVTRQYGLPNPVKGLGALVKYESDQPAYNWEYDGVKITGLSFDDLALYARFRRVVGQRINKLLPKLKDENWETILNNHLGRMRIEKIDGASDEDMLWELVERFCLHYDGVVCDLKEVFSGKPVTVGDQVYFRLSDLIAYTQNYKFQERSPQKIAGMLKRRGAKQEFKKVAGRGVNLWIVPTFQQFEGGLDVPISIREMQKESWVDGAEQRQQSLVM